MKWLVGAILLLVLGAAFDLGLLVYAMYAVIGLVLAGSGLSRRWTAQIEVDRSTPPPALEVGEALEMRVEIRQTGRFGIPWVLAEDALPWDALTAAPPRIKAVGARIRLFDLAPAQIEILEYRIEFLRRGYYQIGPCLIETGDVFGLLRRYQIADQPRFVTILPEIVPLEGYNLASRRPVGEVRLAHRLFEDPTRISGVRPYERGDPLNRIHWRATARTGRLQSKTFEASCVAGATLVVDLHQGSFTGAGTDYRQELAVVTAASLAAALCELGQQVGLITNGRDAADRISAEGWGLQFLTREAARKHGIMHSSSDRLRPVIVPTRRDPGQLGLIRATLGRIEPTDGLALAPLLAESRARLPRDAGVVAILADVSAEAALALGHLRRQGYAVTALVIVFDEPDLSSWAEPPAWMRRLIAEKIAFRRVEDRAALARLCAHDGLPLRT